MNIPTQTEHLSRFQRDIWTDICKPNTSPDFNGIYEHTYANPNISPDFSEIYGQTYVNRTPLQISTGYMDRPTQTEHLSRFQRDIWTDICKPNISPDFSGIYGQTYANRASIQIALGFMDRPTQTEHLSRFQRDLWRG